jgi:pimeloyl-ACP methyl ester carboxylesterase
MNHVTTTDDVKLRVKDWGKGRAVVMMHGWPLSSDTFDDLGMAIANHGMRAISYDRRGFGRSQQPWGGYDYNTLADDLAAVIDQTSAEDVTLLGFSMGGGEVARYLSRHGAAKIRQAVLISSIVPFMLKTADNPKGTDQSVFDGMGKAMQDDRAAFWPGFFKSFYGVGTPASAVSQAVVDWSRDVSMQASLPATLACAKAFATTDLRGDLKSFTVPTLIIHGTADLTVPIDASARAAAKGIPGSTLIEYDGAPHGLLASNKTQLIADVLAFLASRAKVRE